METFKETYLERCKQLSIEPLSLLLNLFKEEESLSLQGCRKPGLLMETLNLSSISLPLKACDAVSAALEKDVYFTKIVIADAFLGDDGCIKVCNALKTNQTVKELDLRGNSIRSDGAVAIGQLLKVNTTLEALFLEWNCLGIWDTGMRAISEGLSMNQTLRTLDLRNNKIGPQAAQTIALCLKQNTALQKLDMRWNHAGLIGGRAFADLLKWNQTLISLELAGNEVPDDTLRAIASAIGRNNDRKSHEMYTRAHAEAMSTTIHTLSATHNDTINSLNDQLSKENHNGKHLMDKLSLASMEIENMQEAFRISQARVERLEKELEKAEQAITSERSQTHSQLDDMQKELILEREKRLKIEKEHEKFIMDSNTQYLKLNSKTKNLELECEILQKDKSMLLTDLENAKNQERNLNQLWTEKLARAEAENHGKLLQVQDLAEKEANLKQKRLNEKLSRLEEEKNNLEKEIELLKSKHFNEKKGLMDQISDLEVHMKKEMEMQRREFENSIRVLSKKNDQLQMEVDGSQKVFQGLKSDHSVELKSLEKKLYYLQEENEKLVQKLSTMNQELDSKHHLALHNQELEKEILQKKAEIKQLLAKAEEEDKERDKLAATISQRNAIIQRLKEEIKKRDTELDTKDEENIIRVLQINIDEGAATKHQSFDPISFQTSR